MADDAVNERRSPYLPKRLPASLRRVPPTSLADRAAAGPYSLASDPLKNARRTGGGGRPTDKEAF